MILCFKLNQVKKQALNKPQTVDELSIQPNFHKNSGEKVQGCIDMGDHDPIFKVKGGGFSVKQSFCIFGMHKCSVRHDCSSFLTLTEISLDVPIFRIFLALEYLCTVSPLCRC